MHITTSTSDCVATGLQMIFYGILIIGGIIGLTKYIQNRLDKPTDD